MSTIITDADVRIEIERYLAVPGTADFDVEAILSDVMDIIRDRSYRSIDQIDAEVFARIVQRHDTSTAPAVADRSPTEGHLRDLYALGAFLTAHAAHIPPRVSTMSLHFWVETRDELNRLADHFEVPHPVRSANYNGAQFSVYPPGIAGTLIFSWEEK